MLASYCLIILPTSSILGCACGNWDVLYALAIIGSISSSCGGCSWGASPNPTVGTSCCGNCCCVCLSSSLYKNGVPNVPTIPAPLTKGIGTIEATPDNACKAPIPLLYKVSSGFNILYPPYPIVPAMPAFPNALFGNCTLLIACPIVPLTPFDCKALAILVSAPLYKVSKFFFAVFLTILVIFAFCSPIFKASYKFPIALLYWVLITWGATTLPLVASSNLPAAAIALL